jgi:hypothetical protein
MIFHIFSIFPIGRFSGLVFFNYTASRSIKKIWKIVFVVPTFTPVEAP